MCRFRRFIANFKRIHRPQYSKIYNWLIVIFESMQFLIKHTNINKEKRGNPIDTKDLWIILMIKAGKKILIVGHENLLRGIIKHLDKMTNEQIMAINIPNGIPFVYELDENLKPVMSMQFLGGEESVRKVIQSAPAHGKVKKLFKDKFWKMIIKK